MLLSEGKGGMANFHEFREKLTDAIFLGKSSEEDQVEAAQSAMGEQRPEDAMEELRRMHAMAQERSQNQPNPAD